MLVDDLPEARDRRVGRDALEHQRRGAVGERAVEDVGVAGDPADVGGAPVDVAVVVVEDVLVRHRGVDEIAAGRVQHALRLAGRARGVEDEERVLGVHLRARAVVGHELHGLVVVDVAAGQHGDGAAGAAHHDDMVDAARALDRRVDIRLERHLAPAAQALVGGDHHPRRRSPRCGSRASPARSRRRRPSGSRRCARRRASRRRPRGSSAGRS